MLILLVAANLAFDARNRVSCYMTFGPSGDTVCLRSVGEMAPGSGVGSCTVGG